MQAQYGKIRRLKIGRWVAMTATVTASTLGAQMPGAPILQNAWAAPGVVAAVDYAGGDGSLYAGAVSWGSATGRFQLSGGLGVRSQSGSTGSNSVYGVRAALPLGGATSPIGFGAFAGVGGGKLPKADSTASNTQVPVGVAVGWRRAVGASHGFSLYATPSYVFLTGGSKSGGVVRTGVGVDFGITKALGATVGAEFGASRAKGEGGPTGTLYGVGVSYALGRR
jgi:hypothetical protein